MLGGFFPTANVSADNLVFGVLHVALHIGNNAPFLHSFHASVPNCIRRLDDLIASISVLVVDYTHMGTVHSKG